MQNENSVDREKKDGDRGGRRFRGEEAEVLARKQPLRTNHTVVDPIQVETDEVYQDASVDTVAVSSTSPLCL